MLVYLKKHPAVFDPDEVRVLTEAFDKAWKLIEASGAKFESDGRVEIYVTATNVGMRAGSEVIQLYVGDEASSVPRPAKELKAFAKVHLAPGATSRATLSLSDRDFAFYSVDARHWLVEPGDFTLLVGTSAADIKLTARVHRTNRLMIPV